MKKLFLCVALLLLVGGCRRGEKRVASVTPADGIVPGETSNNTNTLYASKPFRHCLALPPVPRTGNVEVLIDSSGSMTSVRAALPRLVNWVDLAVSRVRGSALDVASTALCEFNAKDGIGGCKSSIALRNDFRGTGNTNLHDAIRRSVGNELTFIVTDGVAAAGSSASSGNCATAVDAACVARALRDAVHPDGETRGETSRGVWLVPLVAPHDGVFYTEKPIPVGSFDSEAAHEQIRSDIDVDVAIRDPRIDASQRLNFVYRGPRVLLVIVIANVTEVGRAAVAALAETMEQADVRSLKSLKNYNAGIAAFAPVELYPGLAVPIQWGSAVEEDDSTVGTIDARLEGDTLYLDCPRNSVNEATHIVAATTRAAPRQSRCVDILSFPGFNYRLHAAKPDTDKVLASFITSYMPRDPLASKSELSLRIRCGGDQARRSCADNPLRTQYTAAANYTDTSRAFAEPQADSAVALMNAISTRQPQREPHRVYALSDTLRIFYDELSGEQYRVSLGALTICNDEGKQP